MQALEGARRRRPCGRAALTSYDDDVAAARKAIKAAGKGAVVCGHSSGRRRRPARQARLTEWAAAGLCVRLAPTRSTQVLAQALEPAVPLSAGAHHPRDRVAQRLWPDRVLHLASLTCGVDEAGLAERLQVLHHRLAGDREVPRERQSLSRARRRRGARPSGGASGRRARRTPRRDRTPCRDGRASRGLSSADECGGRHPEPEGVEASLPVRGLRDARLRGGRLERRLGDDETRAALGRAQLERDL